MAKRKHMTAAPVTEEGPATVASPAKTPVTMTLGIYCGLGGSQQAASLLPHLRAGGCACYADGRTVILDPMSRIVGIIGALAETSGLPNTKVVTGVPWNEALAKG